jgi:hypothetical protein
MILLDFEESGAVFLFLVVLWGAALIGRGGNSRNSRLAGFNPD